jgi:hypothetical protein
MCRLRGKKDNILPKTKKVIGGEYVRRRDNILSKTKTQSCRVVETYAQEGERDDDTIAHNSNNRVYSWRILFRLIYSLITSC